MKRSKIVDMSSQDRLRRLIDTILRALDERIDGDELAKRAYLSRFHFDRLVKRGLGEAPATFRRRLLLERAAWQLRKGCEVTQAALDSGYDSLEAFSRAYARAFGTAPSRHARLQSGFRLAAPNGIHFHPPAGLHLPGVEDRRPAMDLTERLLEHDLWLTQRAIERAATLDAAQLDREIRPGNVVFRFDGPEPSIRSMLSNHVFAKEVWIAAMSGTPFPETRDDTLPALRTRHEVAGRKFIELARVIRERGEWDDAFVDALCDPPQSFTYGSVIAHIVVHAAHRRMVLLGALRELGIDDVESGCPIDWEMNLGRPMAAC